MNTVDFMSYVDFIFKVLILWFLGYILNSQLRILSHIESIQNEKLRDRYETLKREVENK